MELKVPTRIFPIDKSHFRKDNYDYSIISSDKEQVETIRKVNGFI